MTPTIVQSTTDTQGDAATIQATFTNPPTAGNTIIVVVASNNAFGLFGAPTDAATGSNTYLTAKTQGDTQSSSLGVYYAYNITGGSAHQTVTSSGSSECCCNYPAMSMVAYEVSGLTSTNPIDQTAASFSSSFSATALNSGNTSTTTQASELIFGAGVGANTLSVGSGYSNLIGTIPPAIAGETKTVSSTGAYNATFTSSSGGPWACIVATFKSASPPLNSATISYIV
jgi:hypothetical protein